MLEGDFDPEQFDRMMAQKFGDDYYAQPDVRTTPLPSSLGMEARQG